MIKGSMEGAGGLKVLEAFSLGQVTTKEEGNGLTLVVNASQGFGDAKGSLGLFKGDKALVESQIIREWRVDEGPLIGVECDATLQHWFQ